MQTQTDAIDISIEIVDKMGTVQDDPGGADKAMRRLAVVFGLLDMADEDQAKEYPFISDAPISALSEDTKKQFFVSLLEDKAVNQCIVLNMDMWSAEESKLNSLGEVVKKIVEKDENNQILTIINDDSKVNVAREV